MSRTPTLPRALFHGVLVVALAAGGAAAPQDPPAPEYTGPELYEFFCIVCHGPRGEGSPLGNSLVTPYSAANTDRELIDAITNGRIEKGMISFGGSLTEEEIYSLMVYTRKLQGKEAAPRQSPAPAESPQPLEGAGDPRLGKALFNGKARCIECHSYSNRGGVIGPELDGVAARLGPEGIREAVRSPSKEVARDFAVKVIVTKNGARIRGRYRNGTSDTIQLLNAEGTLWTTYFKDELASIENAGESLMPGDLVEGLDKGEGEALYAFLETLK